MIGLPFNDHQCLGAITQILATMVEENDPVLLELATKYPTTPQLIDYIRSLPQRDDRGDPTDGPRVHACTPPQRVRIGAPDPNCLERACVLVSVEEVNRPEHTYQLATVDTPVGMHTFPLVDGKPIVLDPRVTSECLECGLAINTPGPVAVEPRNAVAWMVDMAAQDAGQLRNGPSALYLGKNAIRRMLDDGAVPAPREIDAMGFLFAIAERCAHRYGTRAIGIVRTAARALADVLDAVLARRNAHIDIGGLKFDTPQWFDETAGAIGNVGLGVGSAYLRTKLAALDLPKLIGLPGGADAIIGLLEAELGDKGRTLGEFAHPPQLATFAKFAAPRTA
ncbi:MAG: hypothetical protein E6J91_00655 [Deltaproteobacteria bacterium]|nr:MAG: hypothetical protein E6J91_00655 [Deltaproteobacteria bacterium]